MGINIFKQRNVNSSHWPGTTATSAPSEHPRLILAMKLLIGDYGYLFG